MSHFALRDPEAGDADWITAACQDHEIQRWLPRVPQPYLREHAEAFIAGASGDLRTWVIERDDEPAGVIGVHEAHPATGVATVGYWIAPWARRMGAAHHALALVAGHVAELAEQGELAEGSSGDFAGITRLHTHIALTNRASRSTAEAAGFHLVEQSATLTCPDGANHVATVVYGLPLAIRLPGA